eukprot:1328464-Amphidinium_carterae.2
MAIPIQDPMAPASALQGIAPVPDGYGPARGMSTVNLKLTMTGDMVSLVTPTTSNIPSPIAEAPLGPCPNQREPIESHTFCHIAQPQSIRDLARENKANFHAKKLRRGLRLNGDKDPGPAGTGSRAQDERGLLDIELQSTPPTQGSAKGAGSAATKVTSSRYTAIVMDGCRSSPHHTTKGNAPNDSKEHRERITLRETPLREPNGPPEVANAKADLVRQV